MIQIWFAGIVSSGTVDNGVLGHAKASEETESTENGIYWAAFPAVEGDTGGDTV